VTLPRRALAQSGYGGRGYRPLGHKQLSILPSVTTVLKAEAKPAIAQWAADQTAAWAVANWEKLGTMADARAFKMLRWYWNRAPKGEPLSIENEMLGYHAGVLSDSGDLGDAVHEWIEADLSGEPCPVDVLSMGTAFWECVAAWNEFKSQHEIKFHRTEITVWNDRADGLGYAGTFDLLLEIDGELTLVDIKTSRGLYSSTWMQLAALYNAPVLLEEGEDGIDKFILGRPSDVSNKGEAMEKFAKLVPMPGNHATHFKSFLGLRTYLEAQRELKSEV
jgi:hypothetical protein